MAKSTSRRVKKGRIKSTATLPLQPAQKTGDDNVSRAATVSTIQVPGLSSTPFSNPSSTPTLAQASTATPNPPAISSMQTIATQHMPHGNPYIWQTQTGGWPSYSLLDPVLSRTMFPLAYNLASTETTMPSSTVPSAPDSLTPTTEIPESHLQMSTDTQATHDSDSKHSSPELDSDESSHQTSTKRVRVSRRNPTHGFVEGAMVGTKEHVVPRSRELRDLETQTGKATRRFKRQVDDLICRAERLTNETECLFILCAQLPPSGLTYHYTSPRFRREALDDASQIVSTFQNTTYALNLAKRKEAKKISETYEQQLTEERAKGRQREQVLHKELETQKAIVEAYRAQLTSRLTVPPLLSSVDNLASDN